MALAIPVHSCDSVSVSFLLSVSYIAFVCLPGSAVSTSLECLPIFSRSAAIGLISSLISWRMVALVCCDCPCKVFRFRRLRCSFRETAYFEISLRGHPLTSHYVVSISQRSNPIIDRLDNPCELAHAQGGVNLDHKQGESREDFTGRGIYKDGENLPPSSLRS